MWWGDDGTLNEAVSKGNIGEDALFREAERLGIDIRKGRDEEPNKVTTSKAKKPNFLHHTTLLYSFMHLSCIFYAFFLSFFLLFFLLPTLYFPSILSFILLLIFFHLIFHLKS